MSGSLITFSKLSADNRVGSVVVAGYDLPFPRQVSVLTEYGWETQELGLLGSALAAGVDSGIGSGSIGAGISALGSKLLTLDNLAAQGANIAGGILDVAGISGDAVTSRGLGMAMNPKLNVYFKGVTHRKFNLKFDLAPTTRQDSIATMKFLSDLHKFAAPELSAGGAFFKYPGTLDVVITGTGGVIINRGNCAITSIDCDLSPDGMWACFNDGKPVHIAVDIGFIELTLPTKDREENLFA